MVQALGGGVYLSKKGQSCQDIPGKVKIHGSPSTLASQIVNLESSLEVENKHQINTSISSPEMKFCTDEALKALQQEKESLTKIVKFMMPE